MRVTVLGCGGSSGVPLIGNQWGACDPANPRNRRLRPSIIVEQGDVRILVDTTPDLRQQLLTADVGRLDAVLWTHQHADHSHGIDELREVCRLMGRPLDVYALPEHIDELSRRFAYCFAPLGEGQPLYRPVLVPHVIEAEFSVAGVPVRPFLQDHGWSRTLGFRFGAFAYSTDVVRLDEAAFAALSGIEVWIVDCVRVEPEHPVHAHLPLTLSWIDRVGPKRAYLTHMNQTMDYATVCAILPSGVEPAYDGLVIELPDA